MSIKRLKWLFLWSNSSYYFAKVFLGFILFQRPICINTLPLCRHKIMFFFVKFPISQNFDLFKEWLAGLTRGIYKELSSFSGSLSGFTPKPSPPKQFTIIKARKRKTRWDFLQYNFEFDFEIFYMKHWNRQKLRLN